LRRTKRLGRGKQRQRKISGESGSTLEIDENTLLEAMPDFIPFLPRE